MTRTTEFNRRLESHTASPRACYTFSTNTAKLSTVSPSRALPASALHHLTSKRLLKVASWEAYGSAFRRVLFFVVLFIVEQAWAFRLKLKQVVDISDLLLANCRTTECVNVFLENVILRSRKEKMEFISAVDYKLQIGDLQNTVIRTYQN